MNDTINENSNDSSTHHGDQFRVTGRVKPTKVGTEILTFSFNLGPLRVVCIANIPGEGQSEAPVYIKLELPAMQRNRFSSHRGYRNDDEDVRDEQPEA